MNTMNKEAGPLTLSSLVCTEKSVGSNVNDLTAAEAAARRGGRCIQESEIPMAAAAAMAAMAMAALKFAPAASEPYDPAQ